MSLTNDMLKNLEKTSSIDRKETTLFEGISPVVSRRFDVFLYALLFIFLLCVGVELFYFFNRASNTLSVSPNVMRPPTIPLMTKSPTPTPSPSPTPSLTPLVIKPHTETLNATYQDALQLLQKNEETLAMAKLNDILNRNPEYEAARMTLATLYLQHKATARATHLLSEGVQLNPQSVNINLLLARSLQSEGQSQSALRVLHNIAAIDSGDVVYRELLAEISQALGDDEKAIALYQDLLKREPDNARWLTGLGIALEGDHQAIAALDAYQRANISADLSPELQDFVTNRIQLLNGK